MRRAASVVFGSGPNYGNTFRLYAYVARYTTILVAEIILGKVVTGSASVKELR